ncbi:MULTISPECIES: type II toxin-antitoxin system death-on-curing family toxin [unclassified Leifsonia]|uniref:type II toxin-antitoxin system death-on-curing family toxin n=1 Tax=unclassified Leifsonia TaxID=2663824 RepID=UPI0008A728FF|nr:MULTISPECIES: type II toxin-antitoxin system death-on-curing family toxin [unclassified Leifsonia]SEI07785.1 death on curing protein [Leifsonia sp. CL154]SFL80380.1 death on curing protein [Leifsonia sp. CL147]
MTLEESLLVIKAVHGGEPLNYLRDTVLLRSALERPAATLFGRDAYPDVYAKGAALLHSILRNHALLDGNKRTGWILCVLFFQLNGYEEHYDEDAMFTVVLAIAAGEIEEVGEIAQQLSAWFTPR